MGKVKKGINLIGLEIGAKVRAMREKREYTQEQLAGAVNLTRTSIVNIEKGRQALTVEILLKMCAVMKCKIVELLPPVPTVALRDSIKKTRVIEYKTLSADFKW